MTLYITEPQPQTTTHHPQQKSNTLTEQGHRIIRINARKSNLPYLLFVY